MVADVGTPVDHGGKPAGGQIDHDGDALGAQGNTRVHRLALTSFRLLDHFSITGVDLQQ